MIKRLASKYIKDLDIDTREKIPELQRLVRLKFVDFCKENGVENTLKSYREYRSVTRAMFGFDLPMKRPDYDHPKVHNSLELF